jgi:hypothetical protein
LISALLRFLPIIIVCGAFGLYFGYYEVNSITVAGALTAILLVWPILVYWDIVVANQWHGLKALFIVLYGIYLSAFIFLSRTGALIGAYMGYKIFRFGYEIPRSSRGRNRDVRDLVINILASLIFSWLSIFLTGIIPVKS